MPIVQDYDKVSFVCFSGLFLDMVCETLEDRAVPHVPDVMVRSLRPGGIGPVSIERQSGNRSKRRRSEAPPPIWEFWAAKIPFWAEGRITSFIVVRLTVLAGTWFDVLGIKPALKDSLGV